MIKLQSLDLYAGSTAERNATNFPKRPNSLGFIDTDADVLYVHVSGSWHGLGGGIPEPADDAVTYGRKTDGASSWVAVVPAAGGIFSGLVELNGGVVVNEAGVDVDVRVEGVGAANAFFVQGSNGFVGINNGAPVYQLDITGNARITTNLGVGGAPATTVAVIGRKDSTDTSATTYIGVQALSFSTPTANAAGYIIGFYAEARHYAFNNTGYIHGGQFNGSNYSTGTAGTVVGAQVRALNATTGTITAAVGLYVQSGYNPSGTIINNYGIYVLGQTAGATNYAIYTNAGAVRLGGNLGLSVDAPRGQIHAHDGTSGRIAWSYAAVDGTAQTVVLNGTGDIMYYSNWMFVVRHSGTGGVNASSYQLAPGASAALYNVAGNTCTIAVAADGSVTVQRTAGTGTYHVSLWGIWL